jgi:leucine-zipper of insertion element IS481
MNESLSRKTGYKIVDRYKEEGFTAISDRSRRPWRYANQLPPPLEAMILGLKRDKPHSSPRPQPWQGCVTQVLELTEGGPLSELRAPPSPLLPRPRLTVPRV